MQDLETFRNIKQQNEFGNFQKPSTEKWFIANNQLFPKHKNNYALWWNIMLHIMLNFFPFK